MSDSRLGGVPEPLLARCDRCRLSMSLAALLEHVEERHGRRPGVVVVAP